jgi:CRP/FNR family transcriptional regulator, anaerobic regulatory protein
MEELLQLMQSIAPLSPGLLDHLRSIIKRTSYKKGAIILLEGDICNSIFYIKWGLVRSYYRLNRKEVSNWFMKETDICISVLSFLRRVASSDAIMALEDCELWGITHKELEETYRLFPEFNVHGRIITAEYYCRSEERHMALKRQPPEDKYEQMMERDPDLVQRVSNKHMSSFLDVGDRTYNLIKKAYHKKKKGRIKSPGSIVM